MRRDRRFWQESVSSAMPEEPAALLADDARSRQRMIGAELRQWYSAIAQESVPDEWLELLSQTDTDPESGQSEQSGRVGST